MLFKAEVCYDYKTDEVLCILHAFTMIMQQEWTKEKKQEQFHLLYNHWLFLKQSDARISSAEREDGRPKVNGTDSIDWFAMLRGWEMCRGEG